MSIIKCKICGGDLQFSPGNCVAECQYCGSRQTIPKADNEKKLVLFRRANHLRQACEFEGAAGVYEAILADFPEEAEAYWGLVLCKYGVDYADDPTSGKKIPTCRRFCFDSVLADPDYEQALAYGDVVARELYRKEGARIEQLRREIIEISAKEPPCDVFLCYKEQDESGNRSRDSVLAQEIYDQLRQKGYRVFFSRISLEDKLGQAYEPYVFAALNSARVMLVIGTSRENIQSVWVRNEWSRYLQLMTRDQSKHLIPCYMGIASCDLPGELQHLQSQDMGRTGSLQDLLRGIEKLLSRQHGAARRRAFSGSGNAELWISRGRKALEEKAWEKAEHFFSLALNENDQCPEAHLGKALAEFQTANLDALPELWIKQIQTPGAVQLQAVAPDREAEERLMRCGLRSGQWTRRQLEEMLSMDLTFPCRSAVMEKSGQEILKQIKENRSLARAEAYGDHRMKAQIAAAQTALEDGLESLLREVRCSEEARICQIRRGYEGHLADLEKLFSRKCREKQIRAAVIGIIIAGVLTAAAAISGLTPAPADTAPVNTDQPDERTAVSDVTLPPGELAYARAEELLASGEAAYAAMAFGRLGDYADARERSYALWDQIARRNTVAAGRYSTIAICEDGTLVTAGEDYNGELDVGQWRDVVSVETFLYHWTAGLCSDGTVLTAGRDMEGKLDHWRDIVSITGVDDAVIGIRSDGTLIAVGDNETIHYAVENWTDIIDVKVCGLSVGEEHIVGLRADGTVVAAGNNQSGQCDVQDWSDMIAIEAEVGQTFGLCDDGLVLLAGENQDGQGHWTNIADIESRDLFGLFGLRNDGTIVANKWRLFGENLAAAKKWSGLAAVCAGDFHLVGLRKDGTMAAAGDNSKGQCNVQGWSNIRLPRPNPTIFNRMIRQTDAPSG